MSSDYVPSIPPGRIRLSIDEYMELPNDGKRYEILDGDLFVTPAPSPRHQKVSRKLQFFLMLALERPGLGEVYDAPIDVILSRHDIFQPDLVFIRRENLHIVGAKNIQGVPDLLVEILSPSTRRTDVLLKSRVYARFRVPAYWIVDPDIDRIELFELEGESYRAAQVASRPEVLRPAAFPDLEIPLDEVFG
jgi:Uma2 family endonuclease